MPLKITCFVLKVGCRIIIILLIICLLVPVRAWKGLMLVRQFFRHWKTRGFTEVPRTTLWWFPCAGNICGVYVWVLLKRYGGSSRQQKHRKEERSNSSTEMKKRQNENRPRSKRLEQRGTLQNNGSTTTINKGKNVPIKSMTYKSNWKQKSRCG